MSNLLKRSLTAIVYVLVMLAGTFLHPISFVLVFASLLFFTQFEFYELVKKAGHRPSKWLGAISGTLYFLISFALARGFLPKQFGLSFIPIILFLLGFEIIRSNKNTLENSGFNIFGFVYIAAPFSLLNFIVYAPINGQTNTFYPWILAGIFFIIWMNDSGAYLIGSAFGKHKMCKNISPKKSWEGFIGGAILAVVMGILNAVFFQAISMISWITIALLTVVFGTLGDLFESKIKREIEIKDSGNIMPGHGGFLDRFDSLLFAIPAIFSWLIFSGNI